MFDKKTLNIIEIFASVQGETRLAGLPTTFVRLAACNLRCSWCDTPYSFGRGQPETLETILNTVKKNGCSHVCITGGEPLLQQNVHLLMSILCDEGYTVSIETGGSLPTQPIDPRVAVVLDIKCPGSKMDNKNLWANLEMLRPHDEVKFVLLDRADYDYAVEVCNKYALFARAMPALFSPVHGILNSQTLVHWILQDNLPVRLNLQLHKFIWTPETRGV